MKKVFLFMLLVLFFCVNISALQITEIEMNPEGTDSGSEWIEFYSNEEINLTQYLIFNNDNINISINETFSGYFVYFFEKQWLDNSDEKAIIYDNSGTIIDETPLLEDGENTNFTWQLCEVGWVFQEQTPEEDCIESEEKSLENGEDENTEPEDTEEETGKNFEDKETIEISLVEESENENEEENRIIMLNFEEDSKDIKTNTNTQLSENGNSESNYETYSLYVFLAFCVLIAGLFAVKKLGKNKNEFE